MRRRISWFYGCRVLAAGLGVGTAADGAVIGSVSVSGSDAAITNGTQAQRENDLGGGIVPFGEDTFGYLDRTHGWNGAKFNSAGTLSSGAVAAGDVIIGLPSYLVGNEYVSTLLTNRDNSPFQLQVTVTQAVKAYLLIDNRVGDGTATNPPTLTSVMTWVGTDGWVQMNTGLSPNGQPDFGGIDEGATITDFNARSTTTTGLSTGPGNGLNNFFSIYEKDFNAGDTITLKEQNDGTSRDMYGLVVAPATSVPEPTILSGAVFGAAALLLRRSGDRRRD